MPAYPPPPYKALGSAAFFLNVIGITDFLAFFLAAPCNVFAQNPCNTVETLQRFSPKPLPPLTF
jgi:hypothetical protein